MSNYSSTLNLFPKNLTNLFFTSIILGLFILIGISKSNEVISGDEVEDKFIFTQIYKKTSNKNIYSPFVRRMLMEESKNSTSIDFLENEKSESDTEDHVDFTNIFGDSDNTNYYYIKVYLGKDKQESSLILDTGSSVMCLTCKNTCKTCGKHEYPDFSPAPNSNFSFVGCADNTCTSFPSYSKCEEDKCKFRIVSTLVIFFTFSNN